ncbi:MAG TPA: C13 family peptidase [Stellaceae bacterium]|nr:C13 family peptidase [Stellaceae bacterium]
MRRAALRFVRLCLCLAALPPLWALSAQAARPTGPEWKAVLVAGDHAQPVFDNAVGAVARWLAQDGVPAAEVHRLSAAPPARDASIEPASARGVLQRIAGLRGEPGRRCLVFLTSHGRRDDGLWLAYRGEFLTPDELAQALALGCARVPTVAIVSSCFSGEFSRGAMQAPNRVVLTAARADRPSFGCQADRDFTVFDECLLATLPRVSTWAAAYRRNAACVRRREQMFGVLPSEPQAFFGAAVRRLSVR